MCYHDDNLQATFFLNTNRKKKCTRTIRITFFVGHRVCLSFSPYVVYQEIHQCTSDLCLPIKLIMNQIPFSRFFSFFLLFIFFFPRWTIEQLMEKYLFVFASLEFSFFGYSMPLCICNIHSRLNITIHTLNVCISSSSKITKCSI